MKQSLLLPILCLISAITVAETEPADDFAAVPEPPILPDPLATGEAIEPVITIIRKDDAVIEEYRINGFLYMVKVNPAIGPAYYMIDNDGDGQMDLKKHDLDDVIVPQWVLLSW